MRPLALSWQHRWQRIARPERRPRWKCCCCLVPVLPARWRLLPEDDGAAVHVDAHRAVAVAVDVARVTDLGTKNCDILTIFLYFGPTECCTVHHYVSTPSSIYAYWYLRERALLSLPNLTCSLNDVSSVPSLVRILLQTCLTEACRGHLQACSGEP